MFVLFYWYEIPEVLYNLENIEFGVQVIIVLNKIAQSSFINYNENHSDEYRNLSVSCRSQIMYLIFLGSEILLFVSCRILNLITLRALWTGPYMIIDFSRKVIRRRRLICLFQYTFGCIFVLLLALILTLRAPIVISFIFIYWSVSFGIFCIIRRLSRPFLNQLFRDFILKKKFLQKFNWVRWPFRKT